MTSSAGETGPCPYCGEPNQPAIRLGLGSLLVKSCEKCYSEWEISSSEREKAAAEEAAAFLRESRHAASGAGRDPIPEALRHLFDTIIPSVSSGSLDLLTCLSGPTGSGKTEIASEWVRRAIDDGHNARLITAPMLVARLGHRSFERGDMDSCQALDYYSSLPALAIDDIGTEGDLPFLLKWVPTVINERMGRDKQTLVTTNLNSKDLAKHYGDRLVSRLSSGLTIILEGIDHRPGQGRVVHATIR